MVASNRNHSNTVTGTQNKLNSWRTFLERPICFGKIHVSTYLIPVLAPLPYPPQMPHSPRSSSSGIRRDGFSESTWPQVSPPPRAGSPPSTVRERFGWMFCTLFRHFRWKNVLHQVYLKCIYREEIWSCTKFYVTKLVRDKNHPNFDLNFWDSGPLQPDFSLDFPSFLPICAILMTQKNIFGISRQKKISYSPRFEVTRNSPSQPLSEFHYAPLRSLMHL